MEDYTHRVYRSLNQPLTILGIERRLFMATVSLAGAMWLMFDSLVVSAALGVVLCGMARVATRRDPQMLPIVMSGLRSRRRFDAFKHGFRCVRKGAR